MALLNALACLESSCYFYWIFTDCGKEFNISNSWVTLSNETDTTSGASADVECHYGYETNVTTIYCQTSGEWETTVCTRIGKI